MRTFKIFENSYTITYKKKEEKEDRDIERALVAGKLP
jgi:hypothetical protein